MGKDKSAYLIKPGEIDAALEYVKENGPSDAAEIGRHLNRYANWIKKHLLKDSRFMVATLDDGVMVFGHAPDRGRDSIVIPGHGFGLHLEGIAILRTDKTFESRAKLGYGDPTRRRNGSERFPSEFSLFAIQPSLIDRSGMADRHGNSLKSPVLTQDYREK